MSPSFAAKYVLPPLFFLCFGIWWTGQNHPRRGELGEVMNRSELEAYFEDAYERIEDKVSIAFRLGVDPKSVLSDPEAYVYVTEPHLGESSDARVARIYRTLKREWDVPLPPLYVPVRSDESR